MERPLCFFSGERSKDHETTVTIRGGQSEGLRSLPLGAPTESQECLLKMIIHRESGGDVAQLVRATDRLAADAGLVPPVRQGIFF